MSGSIIEELRGLRETLRTKEAFDRIRELESKIEAMTISMHEQIFIPHYESEIPRKFTVMENSLRYAESDYVIKDWRQVTKEEFKDWPEKELASYLTDKLAKDEGPRLKREHYLMGQITKDAKETAINRGFDAIYLDTSTISFIRAFEFDESKDKTKGATLATFAWAYAKYLR